MLQQIMVNQDLLTQAVKLSDSQTEAQAVETALKTLIKLKKQAEIKQYRGKLAWEGDLEQMRTDNLTQGMTL